MKTTARTLVFPPEAEYLNPEPHIAIATPCTDEANSGPMYRVVDAILGECRIVGPWGVAGGSMIARNRQPLTLNPKPTPKP